MVYNTLVRNNFLQSNSKVQRDCVHSLPLSLLLCVSDLAKVVAVPVEGPEDVTPLRFSAVSEG